MSSELQNVHIYDGKLQSFKVPVYDTISKNKLFKDIQSKMAPDASLMLNEIQIGGNVDTCNGYDASDLLYHLLLHGKGENFYTNLDEQLIDMYRLGKCPQGRVIRLMSLINAFV
jgi:hypothetical protein